MHGLDQGLLPRGRSYLSRPSHQVDVCVRRRKVARELSGTHRLELPRDIPIEHPRDEVGGVPQRGISGTHVIAVAQQDIEGIIGGRNLNLFRPRKAGGYLRLKYKGEPSVLGKIILTAEVNGGRR